MISSKNWPVYNKVYDQQESCFAADSLFGTALSDQFAESDDVSAPPVLVRCTTELEKRLQETGIYCRSRVLTVDLVIFRSSPGPTRLELRCPSVCTSICTSTSDFHLIWCVGRPRPDMRTSVTLTRSKIKVKDTELPKLRKLHFSRSISSAVLTCSLKLMVDGDSMGPELQLVGARFLNFLLGKLSREFKLRPISIFDEIQMAIFW